ncbi:MAG: hypothetical protein E6214_02065 [Peptoniphilus harei]|nr:hypothetical protein [Peptoniphilus harei]
MENWSRADMLDLPAICQREGPKGTSIRSKCLLLLNPICFANFFGQAKRALFPGLL